MKFLSVAFIVFVFSTVSYADPVYLNCTVSSEEGESNFQVALDEDSKKITHTSETGSAFNTEGFFTFNSITYQRIRYLGSSRLTFKYIIDRRDLSLVSELVVEAIDPKVAMKSPTKTITNSGFCEIQKAGNRKF